MKIEEIRIPAPWGHIAAKIWGDTTNEPIITTHGFQDNAGSFDRLIPLLPEHFCYVCVDLPGHGFSSQFHQNMPVHYHDFLMAYKIVADYFKRSKYILMGHSFGGELSLIFAQLYPTLVSKLIILDAVYPWPIEADAYLMMLKNSYDAYFNKIEKSEKKRSDYTYEEIVNKIMVNRYHGVLTYNTAEDLAKRMVERVGNGRYTITTDPKLNGILYSSATIDYYLKLFKLQPIGCPVLILLAPYNAYTVKSKRLVEYYKEVGFCVKEIEGHHHTHHTDPEVVAPDIITFLNRQCNKL